MLSESEMGGARSAGNGSSALQLSVIFGELKTTHVTYEKMEDAGSTAVLTPDSHSTGSSRGKTKETDTLVEKFVIKIEEETSSLLGATKQGRKVGLWLSDAVLLCLEHLQIFALILSLSLGWAWPQIWISGASFAFLLNLDLWEFIKVHTVYEGQLQAFPDPSELLFSYLGYCIFWLVAVVLLVLLFTFLYIFAPKIPYFSVIFSLLLRAKVVRLFMLIAQAFCLPFGLVVVRLFNCQSYPSGPNGELEFRSVVLGHTQCWSGGHLGILVPMLIVATAYFLALPCWMIHTIKKELISPLICTFPTWRTHENFVRLKEAEYVQGLDVAWETCHYPLFSSFRRPWVWFRPFSFFVKGVLLAVYGSLFYVPYYQTAVLFAFVCVVVLVLAVVPVYRLHSFNFMLVFSVTVNLCNLALGLVLVLRVQSSLLIGINLINALIVINATWLIVAGIWFCYLIIGNLSLVEKKFGPFWPTLPEVDWTSKLKSNHTGKYFQAILAGRKVLEKCYSVPSLFAPVHELSKQIQIVNAYCREAEAVEDPSHDSLWALLSEMIDMYNRLLPHSMFGVSRTDQVYPHIKQLMTLLPDFTRRLEQREYDLILWTQRKRRILLKLLAVATFLDTARNRLTSRHSQCSSYGKRRASTFSGLSQDNQTSKNDEFITDLDKWVAARRASITGKALYPSLSSLQSDEVFYAQSSDSQALGVPNNTTNQGESTSEITTSLPTIGYSRRGSKPNVRFSSYSTIAEYDDLRPSILSYRNESHSSTDNFLERVNEQFDFPKNRRCELN